MSTPFTGSIVGSWLFTRTSAPSFTPRHICHYTSDGKCFWELDYEGKRILSSLKYRLTGSTVILIYSTGTERAFELVVENDGSVCVPSPNGILWWMIRLTSPEPYSKAFVDEHGHLQKLECGQPGAAQKDISPGAQ